MQSLQPQSCSTTTTTTSISQRSISSMISSRSCRPFGSRRPLQSADVLHQPPPAASQPLTVACSAPGSTAPFCGLGQYNNSTTARGSSRAMSSSCAELSSCGRIRGVHKGRNSSSRSSSWSSTESSRHHGAGGVHMSCTCSATSNRDRGMCRSGKSCGEVGDMQFTRENGSSSSSSRSSCLASSDSEDGSWAVCTQQSRREMLQRSASLCLGENADLQDDVVSLMLHSCSVVILTATSQRHVLSSAHG
jgi:hypothetical protein